MWKRVLTHFVVLSALKEPNIQANTSPLRRKNLSRKTCFLSDRSKRPQESSPAVPMAPAIVCRCWLPPRDGRSVLSPAETPFPFCAPAPQGSIVGFAAQIPPVTSPATFSVKILHFGGRLGGLLTSDGSNVIPRRACPGLAGLSPHRAAILFLFCAAILLFARSPLPSPRASVEKGE